MSSPITKVYAVGASPANWTLTPNKYQWNSEDISASDAGRTEDNVMHKKYKGELYSISLGWTNVTKTNAALILSTFRSSTSDATIMVEFLHALTGTTALAAFYVGNKKAPLYNATLGLWESIEFDIILQTPQMLPA